MPGLPARLRPAAGAFLGAGGLRPAPARSSGLRRAGGGFRHRGVPRLLAAPAVILVLAFRPAGLCSAAWAILEDPHLAGAGCAGAACGRPRLSAKTRPARQRITIFFELYDPALASQAGPICSATRPRGLPTRSHRPSGRQEKLAFFQRRRELASAGGTSPAVFAAAGGTPNSTLCVF